MVRKAEFECPCCGGPLRAWCQSQVATVICPTCQREIDIPEPAMCEIGSPRHRDVFETLRLRLHSVLSW